MTDLDRCCSCSCWRRSSGSASSAGCSRLLYTPLMSLTNAISAIASSDRSWLTGADHPLTIRILGAVALFASMTNIVSGFHDHGPHAQDVQEAVMHLIGELSAVLATALFIFALYWDERSQDGAPQRDRGRHRHDRRGASRTWIQPEIIHHGWIVGAIVLGFAVGIPLSRVPLTAVPQRTALSHAFGGLAAGLRGYCGVLPLGSAKREAPRHLTPFRMSALVIEVILWLPNVHGEPHGRGQTAGSQMDPPASRYLSRPEFREPRGPGARDRAGAWRWLLHPDAAWGGKAFIGIGALALIFGVLLIIPIGAPTCRR